MITHRGSQSREPLAESGYEVSAVLPDGEVILCDVASGGLELWFANDNAACYVIDIGGIGYEFSSSYD